MMLNPALFVPAQTSFSSGTSVLTRPMNAYFSPWNHWMSFVRWLVSRCLNITGFPSARTFPLMITDVHASAGTIHAKSIKRLAVNLFIIKSLLYIPVLLRLHRKLFNLMIVKHLCARLRV